jgi:ligand-binding sensor domain-containing protein/AraC-like DNA-binding protein
MFFSINAQEITPVIELQKNDSLYQDKYYHLKISNGLERNSITHITQDKKGQMWFATKEGVVRYDAQKMFYYKYDANDINSIGGNFVERIYAAQDGSVWIGTEPAILSKYNPKNDNFTTINGIKGTRIKDISQDKNGLYWITTNKYLYSYNDKTNELKSFQPEFCKNIDRLLITKLGRFFITTNKTYILEFFPEKKTFKRINVINSDERMPTRSTFSYSSFLLTEDYNGMLWISTYLGFVVKFDPETQQQTRYVFDNKWKKNDNGKLTTMFILEDNKHNIWLGTWFNGLYRISPDQNKVSHFLPDKNRKKSLSNNIIHSGFQDQAGYLWFGTEFAGVNILKKADKFIVFPKSDSKQHLLPTREYAYCIKDKNDQMWIGTKGDGIYNKTTNGFKKNKKLTKHNWSSFVFIDHSQNVWFGDEQHLIKYNPDTKEQTVYNYDRNNYNSLTAGTITSICEDQNNNMWIGTGGGLTKINLRKNKFIRFVHDKDNPKSLSNNYVKSIAIDNNNDVWVGTLSGLNKLNKQSGNFTIFKHDYDKKNGISGNQINDLQVIDNYLWIATSDGGLVKYNIDTKQFKVFDKNNSDLPDNYIKALEVDNHNNLWISTKKYLLELNRNTNRLTKYNESDGLSNSMYITDFGQQNLEFSSGFSFKDSHGYLYFGGIAGIVTFHPDSLQTNTFQPPVMINSFIVNGKKRSINKLIKLKNKENHLSFSLATLNFIQPKKNQYAYQLVGYDSIWKYNGCQNEINYHNLPAGNYIFKYKGANNDGVWSNVYSTPEISIAQVFYKTKLFYFTISLLFLLIILFFIWYKMYLKKKLINQKKKLRYHSSSLKDDEANRISKKIEVILQEKKIYLEADLTLHKLSEHIDEKSHHVSQVINQVYQKRFSDFINYYRIEDAKKMLIDTFLKVEAIAYDSGFNSVSTFHTAFKKETGMTPSKYRKKYINTN